MDVNPRDEHDEWIRLEVFRTLLAGGSGVGWALGQAPAVYRAVTGRTWERGPQDAPRVPPPDRTWVHGGWTHDESYDPAMSD